MPHGREVIRTLLDKGLSVDKIRCDAPPCPWPFSCIPLGFAYTHLAHYNEYGLRRMMAGERTTTGPSRGRYLMGRLIHAESCSEHVCQMHQEKGV
jgi:hypothetical protein